MPAEGAGHDPYAADVVIHVDFSERDGQLELRVEPPTGGLRFVSEASAVERIAPLPREIEFQDVATYARAYKDLLRGFVIGPDTPELENAFEVLLAEFARSGSRPFELRVFGVPLGPHRRNPATLPWELILYGNPDEGLIGRAAVVRSLKRTEAYAPSTLSEPLRTLVVQGGQYGTSSLRFDKDRANLRLAWQDLGRELRKRVLEPVVEPVSRAALEDVIRRVDPHVLWFSGHGDVDAGGFRFLFADDSDFTPSSEITGAIRRACTHRRLPLVAAFWTCESMRLGSDQEDAIRDADLAPTSKGVAAVHDQLPALVAALAEIGIEAVIGCQTRVLDACARVMAKALFRNLAEGQGPARALAAARAELARGSEAMPPGGEAEWPSPVLWIGGARMPLLRWDRPPGEDEAILLDRLGRESVVRDVFAASIWAQDPGAIAPTTNWIARAPCWVVHKSLSHDVFGVFASLRRQQWDDGRALLVIPVAGADSDNFLRAFGSTMRELHGRVFPGVELGETEWLMSVFALASVERRREDAWRRLLERKDLVIAIIARGGLTDLQPLNEAMERHFPVVVFSPSAIDGEGMGTSKADDGAWWSSDVFGTDASAPEVGADLRPFLEALATLNRPMSRDEIDDFGRDFEISNASGRADFVLMGYGGRFVLRATVADALTRSLDAEHKRAAHAACLLFLERRRVDPFGSPVRQLHWRLEHAQALDRRNEVVALASEVITGWRDEGRHGEILTVYRSLKEVRRGLPAARLLDVAAAYISEGSPLRALDVLTHIDPEVLSARERVHFTLRHAEALRNTNDQSNREQAIALQAEALRAVEALERQHPADRNLGCLVLVVRHDLARNELYFHGSSRAAREVYQDVISKCGSDPDRNYLKVAALRNLADVSDRYAYDGQRNPAQAVDHLESAIRLVGETPASRSMLPEILYALAKALARAARTDESIRRLNDALKIARRDGNALILALAGNRHFWSEHGGDESLGDTVWPEWCSVARQLDSVEHHAWAARALVNTRLRAAKRRAGLRPDQAITVLSEARDLMRRHDGLRGRSDIAERWIPTYAGLAVLQRRSDTVPPQTYDRVLWRQLARDLPGEPAIDDVIARDPTPRWNAVP